MSDYTIPTFQKHGTSILYFVVAVERESVIVCSIPDGIVLQISHEHHQLNMFYTMISEQEAINALDEFLKNNDHKNILYNYVIDFLDTMYEESYGHAYTQITMIV